LQTKTDIQREPFRCFIGSAGVHGSRFVSGCIFVGDEVGPLRARGHYGVGHRFLFERAHKISMDEIECYPLDAEIEVDDVSDPFGIESERSTEMR
jgi:hypothetical protein